MARKRPTASDVVPQDSEHPATKGRDPSALTRAEAHALRRSAPLTPAQFKSLRRLADQGENPLRPLR
ncbi:MAG: hypothetical protein ACLGI5_03325 [Thermoleophilia bacterium]